VRRGRWSEARGTLWQHEAGAYILQSFFGQNGTGQGPNTRGAFAPSNNLLAWALENYSPARAPMPSLRRVFASTMSSFKQRLSLRPRSYDHGRS
jgi:hypothetical protein